MSAQLTRRVMLLGVSLVAALAGSSASAAASAVLTDVIKSTGSGTINLFKDVTAAQLEQLRLDNGGALVLAVDVNEAASGTEKADSQAVALKSVQLHLTVAGQTYVYSQFDTQTKALLAEGTSTTRAEYYTLLGDTGSSRITSGHVISDRFDSTLRVPVDMSVALATAARVEISLLVTNQALGDPEAFYDFSNGYEDLALVTAADARFLDQQGPGRDEAPAVILTYPPAPDPLQVTGWLYYPSASGYYIVAYEDKYPLRGDYDFNDLTVAYRLHVGVNSDGDVVRIDGIAILITRGAEYSHDWHLHLALPATASGIVDISAQGGNGDGGILSTRTDAFTGAVDVVAFSDSRHIFVDQSYAFVNTLPVQAFIRGPKASFQISLNAPLALDSLPAAPFDPYLYVRTTGYEIHLPGQSATLGSANLRDGYTSFKDAQGFPFAMIVPDAWVPPVERTDMGVAYPDLASYVSSGGKQKISWYLNPSPGHVRNMTSSDWLW